MSDADLNARFERMDAKQDEILRLLSGAISALSWATTLAPDYRPTLPPGASE